MLSHWAEPREHPFLEPGDLHLWRVWLDRPGEGSDAPSWLTPGERERAGRLRRPLDRRRWISSRRWLRWLIGGYAQIDPSEIGFVGGPRAKPEIREAGGSALRFNVSHSAGVALFVFALETEVGVDVQSLREGIDVDGIARRVLGADAAETLSALPEPQRLTRFTLIWARHEAAAKCRGAGLDERQWPEVSAGLWIADVRVGEGFGAAVAASSAPQRMRMWEDGHARIWA
jgi:4'-phosphopantetheinyl transferase